MNWQEMIRKNATTADDIRDYLHLSQEEYEAMKEEIGMFPMSVTQYYLSLINPEDPEDPIRKMAIPSGHVVFTDGELDTSGEHTNTKLQGLQHKYRQTALILTTRDCAMFCRHCFRRRLVGKDSEEIAWDLEAVTKYIRSHPEITNVLLSCGDSFMMTTDQIGRWLEKLTVLDQLDFIRFGTRTPVTFPQRILTDPSLTHLLRAYAKRKQIYVVTHFNHPREFTEESIAAIRALQKAGAAVKNQTVFLKGVNDDPQVLADLLRGVTRLGMTEHYIFQCRPVKGVKSRFQVPVSRGIDIVQEALAMQNGLGKSADYTMSHVTGKIRILGKTGSGEILFQYKQAKDPARIGKIFTLKLDEEAAWLPETIEL